MTINSRMPRIGMKGLQKEVMRIERSLKETNIFVTSLKVELEEFAKRLVFEEAKRIETVEDRVKEAEEYCGNLHQEYQSMINYYDRSKRGQEEILEYIKVSRENL